MGSRAIDVNYIFIDKSDRELFNSNLRYLVEPVSKTVLNDLSGEIVNHMQLYHQVKELYIVGQRNDVEKRNMWLNFTNFDDDYETNYLDYQNNFFRLSSLKSKSTIWYNCITIFRGIYIARQINYPKIIIIRLVNAIRY